MEEAQLGHLSPVRINYCSIGFEEILCKLVDFLLIFLAPALHKAHALHSPQRFSFPLPYFYQIVFDDVVLLKDGHSSILVWVQSIQGLEVDCWNPFSEAFIWVQSKQSHVHDRLLRYLSLIHNSLVEYAWFEIDIWVVDAPYYVSKVIDSTCCIVRIWVEEDGFVFFVKVHLLRTRCWRWNFLLFYRGFGA